MICVQVYSYTTHHLITAATLDFHLPCTYLNTTQIRRLRCRRRLYYEPELEHYFPGLLLQPLHTLVVVDRGVVVDRHTVDGKGAVDRNNGETGNRQVRNILICSHRSVDVEYVCGLECGL